MNETQRSEVDAGDDNFVVISQTKDDIILIENIPRSDDNSVDLPSKFPTYYPPAIEVRNTSYYEVDETKEKNTTNTNALNKVYTLKLVGIILLVMLLLLAFGLGLVIGLAKSSSDKDSNPQSIVRGVDHGCVSEGSGDDISDPCVVGPTALIDCYNKNIDTCSSCLQNVTTLVLAVSAPTCEVATAALATCDGCESCSSEKDSTLMCICDPSAGQPADIDSGMPAEGATTFSPKATTPLPTSQIPTLEPPEGATTSFPTATTPLPTSQIPTLEPTEGPTTSFPTARTPLSTSQSPTPEPTEESTPSFPTARKPLPNSPLPTPEPTEEPTTSFPTATTTLPTSQLPTSESTEEPTTSSPTATTPLPTSRMPTPEPTEGPTTPFPTATTPPFIREEYPYTAVLTSNEQLYLGDIVTSPNKMFSFSFTNEGSLVLRKSDSDEILWSNGEKGATKCSLQPDGNLVLRRKDKTTTWKSATHKNPGAELHLDDGGQISIVSVEGTALWLAGLPRGIYTGRQRESLNFPIRGIFYYPWYPETWTVRGTHVFYNPNSGYYSSGDGDIQTKHVETLDYIHADVAIASWFGPDTHRDRARLTNLMVKSKSIRTKWTVYHEEEFREDQSVDDLRQDLAYLKKWFVWRDTWAHVDNKPLIFVYNEGDCDVVNRWVEASRGEWYVVLKVFHERESCSSQPDGWHQYGPSRGVHHHTGLSYSISPGFWRADAVNPALARHSEGKWRQLVKDMVESDEPWQLIVSFNEWGEGTAIESAVGWESKTGYGYYVDALHDIH